MYSKVPLFNALSKKKSPFISKLVEILSKPEYTDIISWDENGVNITIYHIINFEAQVLPVYFESSRMDSFTRQLNLYGFKRVSDGRKQRANPHVRSCTFSNPTFTRDNPDQYHSITRKKKVSKRQITSSIIIERSKQNKPPIKLKPITIPDCTKFMQPLPTNQICVQPLSMCIPSSHIDISQVYPYSTLPTPVTFASEYYPFNYDTTFIPNTTTALNYPYFIDPNTSLYVSQGSFSSNLSSPGVNFPLNAVIHPDYS